MEGHLADDVEEEWLDVIVERLVVEEELREEAEVLTVDALILGVDLKDGDRVLLVLLPVDLVAWRWRRRRREVRRRRVK